MAKSSKSPDSNGKVKFRIIEFELEGSDSTIEESLKNIASAFVRSTGHSHMKAVRQDTPRQLNNTSADAVEELSSDMDTADIQEAVVVQQQPKRVSTPKKPVAVSILKDIRLDDAEPNLKDFCASKSPRTDLAKYLAIAYWFKFHKSLPDLTPDHFYTAYRFMQWTVPRDPAQPIRDLRGAKRGQLSAGDTPGTCTINHIGENAVNNMGGSD